MTAQEEKVSTESDAETLTLLSPVTSRMQSGAMTKRRTDTSNQLRQFVDVRKRYVRLVVIGRDRTRQQLRNRALVRLIAPVH